MMKAKRSVVHGACFRDAPGPGGLRNAHCAAEQHASQSAAPSESVSTPVQSGEPQYGGP